MAADARKSIAALFLLSSLCAHGACKAAEEAHAEHKGKFMGTYMLMTFDTRTRSQRSAVCEIQDNRILIDEQAWGTWEAKNAKSMTIVPSNPTSGEVILLRRTPTALAGQEGKGATAVRWSLDQVFVVGRWRHQAGNMPPIEMPLWSTGRAFKPDSRIKWKHLAASRELILEWPETTDRCKLSADGNRYEGRNEHGTLITGKKIH